MHYIHKMHEYYTVCVNNAVQRLQIEHLFKRQKSPKFERMFENDKLHANYNAFFKQKKKFLAVHISFIYA